jgi:DNA modification methylase
MIRDIHPRTAAIALSRDALKCDRFRTFDLETVASLAGMTPAFVRTALSLDTRAAAVNMEGVFALLEQDAFAETFVPRSKIPEYLLRRVDEVVAPRLLLQSPHELIEGNALHLLPLVRPATVQCVVTSTPYWGMRVYDDHFVHQWADGEQCAFGNEQTPEGFIRHSLEALFLLRPALSCGASIWWNLMDTYNTRTQIRTNAAETLNAMQGNETRTWHDYVCRRYSAGHSYLKDGEQCHIPSQIANRASRIGYFVKSVISWKKLGSLPETVESRVTREVEYVIHLAVQRAPFFDKTAFLRLPQSLGGRNRTYESEKLTDVWHFSTAQGSDGHGAQFPVALPGRCIALSTRADDLVLDPFVGSATTCVAASLLGRRSLGFDVSEKYLEIGRKRLQDAQARPPLTFVDNVDESQYEQSSFL